MELISEELLNKIPDLYETERSINPICHIKLFTPDSIFKMKLKTILKIGLTKGWSFYYH